MRITYNKQYNAIEIEFRYDPQIVSAIKTVPGRLYHKEKRIWSVPSYHVEKLLDTLSFFSPDVSDEVFELKEKVKLYLETSLSIKRQELPPAYRTSLPLYEFQKKGSVWMTHMKRCLLADQPGLGKTIQTIAALSDSNLAPSNILVIANASNKYDPWENEIKKWSSETPLIIGGKAEERSYQWASWKKYKWIVCNYELILRDYDLIKEIKWDAIVCDEAQRISNPSAKTTRAIKSLHAEIRIALTGTPVSNSPVDIFSIMDWLHPGYLGNYKQFFADYVVEDNFGNVRAYKNLPKLFSLLEPFILRRTKEEVLDDFPSLTIQQISFDLSLEEQKIYAAIKTTIIDELGGYIDKIDPKTLALVPVKMLRLLQTIDHPKLIGEQFEGDSSKLKATKEHLVTILSDIKMLSTGQIPIKEYTVDRDKLLIFTQFKMMAYLLQKELQNYSPLVITGDVSSEDRIKIIEQFNTDPQSRLMILTEAGSTGINLQAASYVINYDLPWSIAKLEQRIGRAHRIGQKKNVTVYNLIAKNTIDEYISSVLHKKKKISDDILVGEKFSQQDIINLLT